METPARQRELLRELVRVCRRSSEAAALFHEPLVTESGEFTPQLAQASAQTVPKMQLLHEQRVLLAASPYPRKLMEKIEQLKDAGVHGIDRYIWLVGHLLADPDLKKLVSLAPGDAPSSAEFAAKATLADSPTSSSSSPALPSESSATSPSLAAHRSARASPELRETSSWPFRDCSLGESVENGRPSDSHRPPKTPMAGGASATAAGGLVPRALVEGVSFPGTPRWNLDRPYLTGKHLYQQDITVPTTLAKFSKKGGLDKGGEIVVQEQHRRPLGDRPAAVQELLVIDDLLYMMVGIEGTYIRVKRGRLKENSIILHVDPSMDPSLQEMTKQLLPLCENFLSVSQFTESRTHFKYGLVNQALAAALRAILHDYNAMVAQLDHQFRLTRLSMQGLWFFCQPMMAAMQVLATVVRKAESRNLSGAAILNLLQNQATAMAGDSSARALLQKLTQAASAPYLGILEKWVTAGLIADPYGEFLIDENKALQKESLSQDYHATYWQQRYSLRQDYPAFLNGHAETILTTGKYLNAVRECGGVIKIPSSTGADTSRPFLEHIGVAYRHASAELVKLVLTDFDLVGRLRSLKHYFFMDQGDFLVHFMDIARDELLKRSANVTMEKLQSLLELALRTSVSASDPYHDDLVCNVEKSTLLSQLQATITSRGGHEVNGVYEPFTVGSRLSGPALGAQGQAAPNVTGIETFSLDYKVRWPVSLVISRKALTKYQLIFRHLFHFKDVERSLCMTWQAHQATRHLGFAGTAIAESYVLCQRMLHFLQGMEHYMTFEVLEPNWHVMETKIQREKSVDEIIQQHDKFLDKCLRECMLLWPSILKKVESLKVICQQYATTTQRLIPSSMASAKEARSREPSPNPAAQQKKLKKRSRPSGDRAWKPEDETNFRSILGGIDQKFKTQLKELISVLSMHSQTEPCFAHLAQALQGDEQARLRYLI